MYYIQIRELSSLSLEHVLSVNELKSVLGQEDY